MAKLNFLEKLRAEVKEAYDWLQSQGGTASGYLDNYEEKGLGRQSDRFAGYTQDEVNSIYQADLEAYQKLAKKFIDTFGIGWDDRRKKPRK